MSGKRTFRVKLMRTTFEWFDTEADDADHALLIANEQNSGAMACEVYETETREPVFLNDPAA